MHTSTGGVFYTLAYIYEEEDTCHMRRRIHACTPLSYHIQAHTQNTLALASAAAFCFAASSCATFAAAAAFCFAASYYVYICIHNNIYIYIYIQIMNEALVSVRSTDIRG